jgi:hypothetical protein
LPVTEDRKLTYELIHFSEHSVNSNTNVNSDTKRTNSTLIVNTPFAPPLETVTPEDFTKTLLNSETICAGEF